MLVMSDTRFSAFEVNPPGRSLACRRLDWDAYCECEFASDEANRVKCKSKPWSCCPVGICPPWASPNSDYGAGCRGIPRQGSGGGYTVGNVMSTIDIGSQVATSIQVNAIRKNEAVAQQNEINAEQSQDAARRAAVQRALILKWAKYGAIAAGGLVVLVVAKKALRPRAPVAAVGSYKHRLRRAA